MEKYIIITDEFAQQMGTGGMCALEVPAGFISRIFQDKRVCSAYFPELFPDAFQALGELEYVEIPTNVFAFLE